METKTCKTCNETKPLEDFGVWRGTPTSQCKTCYNKYMQEYRKSPSLKAKMRAYWKSPEGCKTRSRYQRSPKGLERPKRWHAKNPGKRAVYQMVAAELRAGRMTKPAECSHCGLTPSRIDGHHEDYSKPLEVTWLCRECHWRRHAEMGAEGILL